MLLDFVFHINANSIVGKALNSLSNPMYWIVWTRVPINQTNMLTRHNGSLDSQSHHYKLCVRIKQNKIVSQVKEPSCNRDGWIPHASSVIIVQAEQLFLCLLDTYQQECTYKVNLEIEKVHWQILLYLFLFSVIKK